MCVVVIYCGKLPDPINCQLSTDRVAYNSLVTVECDPGFVLADGRFDKTLRCMNDGNWNDSTTTNCQRNDDVMITRQNILTFFIVFNCTLVD